jgi:O2-independent ubiquinone biosynthesis protein UbiV
MKLTLAPLAFYWSKDSIFKFYQNAATSEFDVIYLGETVCSKRRQLRLEDWLKIAEFLIEAGKTVVLSSLTLLASKSEQAQLKKLTSQTNFEIEANDYSAVQLLSEENRGFIAGPTLNIYSQAAIKVYQRLGMRRWIAPYEASGAQITTLANTIDSTIETELFVYGHIPLAWAARCFTARHENVSKDECEIVCKHFPKGIDIQSQEHQALFILNGVQTLSATVINYLSVMDEIMRSNVSYLRLSAHDDSVFEMASQFRKKLRGERLDTIASDQSCNGFWFNQSGIEQVNV